MAADDALKLAASSAGCRLLHQQADLVRDAFVRAGLIPNEESVRQDETCWTVKSASSGTVYKMGPTQEDDLGCGCPQARKGVVCKHMIRVLCELHLNVNQDIVVCHLGYGWETVRGSIPAMLQSLRKHLQEIGKLDADSTMETGNSSTIASTSQASPLPEVHERPTRRPQTMNGYLIGPEPIEPRRLRAALRSSWFPSMDERSPEAQLVPVDPATLASRIRHFPRSIVRLRCHIACHSKWRKH